MRWRSVLVTASSALLVAGCGSAHKAAPPPPPRPPRIPTAVATRLASQADSLAKLAAGSCMARDAAARFRSDVIAAVGSIPSRYQEPLLSAANDLAHRLAACTQPQPEKKDHEEHGKKRGHKKHKDEQ
jgi:hypothetical protein